VRTLPQETPWGGAGALSPDGALAAILTQDGEVVLRDTASGTRRSFKAHGLGPSHAFFDSKGNLVTLAWDWSVKFWNAQTWEKTDDIDLRGLDDVPYRAAISSDGRTLLVATLRSLVLRFEAR